MSAAIATLNASGFTNIETEYQTVYTSDEDGKVLSQTPSPSSTNILGMTQTYSPDTKITIVVGQKIGV